MKVLPTVILYGVLIMGGLIIGGVLVQFLWNIAMVPLGVRAIDSIGQAICLILLSYILFGGLKSNIRS